jgi:hypothetical protein
MGHLYEMTAPDGTQNSMIISTSALKKYLGKNNDYGRTIMTSSENHSFVLWLHFNSNLRCEIIITCGTCLSFDKNIMTFPSQRKQGYY